MVDGGDRASLPATMQSQGPLSLSGSTAKDKTTKPRKRLDTRKVSKAEEKDAHRRQKAIERQFAIRQKEADRRHQETPLGSA